MKPGKFYLNLVAVKAVNKRKLNEKSVCQKLFLLLD